MRRSVLLACLTLAAAATPAAAQRKGVPTPASVLGFEPGTDRRLAEWDDIVAYFLALEGASDRVVVREIGRASCRERVYGTV